MFLVKVIEELHQREKRKRHEASLATDRIHGYSLYSYYGTITLVSGQTSLSGNDKYFLADKIHFQFPGSSRYGR